MAEEVAFEGVSVHVVLPGTGFELVECVRMWVGVHQRSQRCVALLGDGYMEGGGKLSNKGGLKDMWLIVKREI
jgi:hypothetical protein